MLVIILIADALGKMRQKELADNERKGCTAYFMLTGDSKQ